LLGSWHPYKLASAILWRNFANFLGPLFHNFHPGSKYFLEQSKLSKITYWLSLVRLSFPKWKNDLNALLGSPTWKFSMAVTKDLHVHLQNLKVMVEYFIPLVIFPLPHSTH
jgi:hypothetical protein